MRNIDEIAAAIELRAKERFEISRDLPATQEASLLEGALHVMRLQRKGRSAGARTILVVQCSNERESLRGAFMVAAHLRDSMPEPEASDLYMIMAIDSVSDQNAARIETDDRFCRKYVLRNDENIYSLLDRSFLVSDQGGAQRAAITDPFRVAISAVADAHPWVKDYIDAWRLALLSGDSNSELVDKLLETAKNGGSDGNS